MEATILQLYVRAHRPCWNPVLPWILAADTGAKSGPRTSLLRTLY